MAEGINSHWRYYKFNDMASEKAIVEFVKQWEWKHVETRKLIHMPAYPYEIEFNRPIVKKVLYPDEPQWDHPKFRIPNTR